MDYSVFDIEADGLIENATRIHCMSVTQYRNGVITRFSFVNYDDMRGYLEEEQTLVGHNIIRYDIPMLEKFLGINLSGKRQVDTLGLSWYLYPLRNKHGLDEWGNDLGIEKPKITNWSNLPIEDYLFRCEEDVKINVKLFDMQIDYLFVLYNNDSERVNRFINYLSFKLLCAREQEEVKWRLDVAKCELNLNLLIEEARKKVVILREIMPKTFKYKDVARPKTLYKKDGEISVAGGKWLTLLQEKGLPEFHLGTIKVVTEENPGNPGSHQQLKAWLFSLGWIPQTFKYTKQKDGSQKKIPQLNKDDNSGDICDSVQLLFEAVPELEHLEGLFVLRHRIGLLKGFLENRDEKDFLKAEIQGFTNTLRFQHTTIVNLPQIPKPYWEEVRGCLIAPDDNHVLCGSDMSGLEDSTKRHYMFYYDPEYVIEMMSPDFDPHIDVAVRAEMLTPEEGEEHKLYDRTKGKEGKSHKPVRLTAKKGNFGSVYGAGPPKLALTMNIPLPRAKVFHKAYWTRNWSVKKIANNTITKTIGEQMWLFNPVSQFWYSLRLEKDKFSTLNQGTGVYCFDSWVRKVRAKGIRNCGQFHDEIISPILKGTQDDHKSKLMLAIKETNDELQLNVELRISIDFGDNYAQIH